MRWRGPPADVRDERGERHHLQQQGRHHRHLRPRLQEDHLQPQREQQQKDSRMFMQTDRGAVLRISFSGYK